MMMRRIGAVIVLIGVGLMTAPVVFTVVTNVTTLRAQQADQAQWEQQLETARRSSAPSQKVAVTAPRAPAPAPRAVNPRPRRAPPVPPRRQAKPAPAAVQPFMLAVPKIGLRWLIREGTSIPHLRRNGAGHIPGTAAPGQTGVVGIAGHRTTYGAPFFRLSRVGRGDEVTLQTRAGRFIYRVYDVRQVRPTQVEVLNSKGSARLLVLVTCSPPFSAKFRLVVFARLVTTTASVN